MSRLRITAWPEAPVKELPVEMLSAKQERDGTITWVGMGRFQTLPSELVLRELRELNTSNSLAVMDFVNRYGPIRRRYQHLDESITPVRVNFAISAFGADALDPWGLTYLDDSGKLVSESRPPIYSWRDDDGIEHDVGDQPMARSEVWNHVTDVLLHLKTMRAAVNHWLLSLDGADVAQAWDQEGAVVGGDVGGIAWTHFEEAMNRGLSAYRMRVEYAAPIGTGESFTFAAPRPDLYSAMCLQLFNLMVDDLPVLACANETCGKRFVRQQGRALYDQHRTEGVKYCSKSCARAQANRDYRRRQRNGKARS